MSNITTVLPERQFKRSIIDIVLFNTQKHLHTHTKLELSNLEVLS